MNNRNNKKDFYRGIFQLGERNQGKLPANDYKRCYLRKGDTVRVITGSDKGKTGKIIEFDRKTGRVKVEGVNMQTHFAKQGNIQQKEGGVHISNVMIIDPQTNKPTRCKKDQEGIRVTVKTSSKV